MPLSWGVKKEGVTRVGPMRLEVILVEGPLMLTKNRHELWSIWDCQTGFFLGCPKVVTSLLQVSAWPNMFYSSDYVNKLIWSGKSERGIDGGIKCKTKGSARELEIRI